MVEFSVDDYKRKFAGCTCVYVTKDGKTEQGSIYEIGTSAALGVWGNLSTDVERLHSLSSPEHSTYIDLLYYPLRSGVFQDTSNSRIFHVLERKHVKSYYVGLNTHNWNIISINKDTGKITEGHHSRVALLQPIPTEDYNGNPSGYLNKDVWWTADQIMYRNTQIGFFRKNTLRISHASYAPLIQQLWGNKCQVQVL